MSFCTDPWSQDFVVMALRKIMFARDARSRCVVCWLRSAALQRAGHVQSSTLSVQKSLWQPVGRPICAGQRVATSNGVILTGASVDAQLLAPAAAAPDSAPLRPDRLVAVRGFLHIITDTLQASTVDAVDSHLTACDAAGPSGSEAGPSQAACSSQVRCGEDGLTSA